jgi:tetratricopeptide (TPR) repeat protein
MLNVRRYAAQCALLALIVCSTSWAAPNALQADAAARKALESKQYADVVKAYEGIEKGSLSDQAFYRLAIAQQRLGNAQEAKKALNLALGLNPKGSFASSPERLTSLQKDIDKSLAQPASVVATTPETSNSQTASASTAVSPVAADAPVVHFEPSATAPTVSDTASVASNHPAQEVKILNEAFANQQAQSPLPASETSTRTASVLFWVVLCLVIALAGLSFVMWKILSKMRVANADNSALASLMKTRFDELSVAHNRPMLEVGGLVALRDEVVKMRDVIATAERQDSALAKLLDKLEPLVEAEIGRNLFRKSRNPVDLSPADQQMLELVQLEPAAMTLEGAEPEAVMRHLVGGQERFKKLIGV